MRLSLPALLLLSACTRSTLIEVEVVDDGLYAVILRDGAKRLARVERPFLVVDGLVVEGERTQTEIGADHEDALLLYVPTETLIGFDREGFEVFDVELRPPPASPRVLNSGARFVEERGVPESAVFFEATESGLLDVSDMVDHASDITLLVPFDPEHCGPKWSGLAPFTADLETLGAFEPGNRFARRMMDVRWVDPDHAVAMTDVNVLHLTRGETWAEGPSTVIRNGAVGSMGIFSGADINRSTGALAVTARSPSGEAAAGELLWFDVASGLRFVRTATSVSSKLRAVAIGDDGSAYALGDDGFVIRELDTGEIEQLPGFAGEEAWSLTTAGDSVIAATSSQIHTYTGGLWTGANLDYPQSVHFHGLAADARQVWAGGSDGELVVSDGRFRPVVLDLPPSLTPCSGLGGTARPTLTKTITSIALDGTHAYLGLEDCNVLLAVERETLCTTSMPLGDPIEVSEDFPMSIDLLDDHILVSTQIGRVYTAERTR